MKLSKEKLPYENPAVEVMMFDAVDIVTNSDIDYAGRLPVDFEETQGAPDWWN